MSFDGVKTYTELRLTESLRLGRPMSATAVLKSMVIEAVAHHPHSSTTKYSTKAVMYTIPSAHSLCAHARFRHLQSPDCILDANTCAPQPKKFSPSLQRFPPIPADCRWFLPAVYYAATS